MVTLEQNPQPGVVLNYCTKPPRSFFILDNIIIYKGRNSKGVRIRAKKMLGSKHCHKLTKTRGLDEDEK